MNGAVRRHGERAERLGLGAREVELRAVLHRGADRQRHGRRRRRRFGWEGWCARHEIVRQRASAKHAGFNTLGVAVLRHGDLPRCRHRVRVLQVRALCAQAVASHSVVGAEAPRRVQNRQSGQRVRKTQNRVVGARRADETARARLQHAVCGHGDVARHSHRRRGSREAPGRAVDDARRQRRWVGWRRRRWRRRRRWQRRRRRWRTRRWRHRRWW